jgi:hypothetical protein
MMVVCFTSTLRPPRRIDEDRDVHRDDVFSQSVTIQGPARSLLLPFCAVVAALDYLCVISLGESITRDTVPFDVIDEISSWRPASKRYTEAICHELDLVC